MTVPKIEPDAAEKARAADHHGGNDGEFIARAGDRFGGIEPRRQHEGAEPRKEAHDDIDAADDPVDIEAARRAASGLPPTA